MQKRVNLVDLVKSFQTSTKKYLIIILKYFLAKFSLDTAENEPSTVSRIRSATSLFRKRLSQIGVKPSSSLDGMLCGAPRCTGLRSEQREIWAGGRQLESDFFQRSVEAEQTESQR